MQLSSRGEGPAFMKVICKVDMAILDGHEHFDSGHPNLHYISDGFSVRKL
jgi:hypothetical protein